MQEQPYQILPGVHTAYPYLWYFLGVLKRHVRNLKSGNPWSNLLTGILTFNMHQKPVLWGFIYLLGFLLKIQKNTMLLDIEFSDTEIKNLTFQNPWFWAPVTFGGNGFQRAFIPDILSRTSANTGRLSLTASWHFSWPELLTLNLSKGHFITAAFNFWFTSKIRLWRSTLRPAGRSRVLALLWGMAMQLNSMAFASP